MKFECGEYILVYTSAEVLVYGANGFMGKFPTEDEAISYIKSL